MNPADPTPEAPPVAAAPEQEQEAGNHGGTEGTIASTGTSPFSKLTRDITQEDLTHPAVARLVLAMLDQAREECSQLRHFQENYNEEKFKTVVLQEKLKNKTAFDIVCRACFGAGAIIVGFVPWIWNLSGVGGNMALLIGVILIGGSVFAEIRAKW